MRNSLLSQKKSLPPVRRTAQPSVARGPLPLAPATVQRALADPASLAPAQVLSLQRSVGNRALVQVTSRTPAERVQRNGGQAVDAFAGEPTGKWAAFKRVFYTAKKKAKVDTPQVAPDDLAAMYATLTAAREAEAQTRELGLPEEMAEEKLKAVPESYRPRRISPSEKQVKANEAAFLQEAVEKLNVENVEDKAKEEKQAEKRAKYAAKEEVAKKTKQTTWGGSWEGAEVSKGAAVKGKLHARLGGRQELLGGHRPLWEAAEVSKGAAVKAKLPERLGGRRELLGAHRPVWEEADVSKGAALKGKLPARLGGRQELLGGHRPEYGWTAYRPEPEVDPEKMMAAIEMAEKQEKVEKVQKGLKGGGMALKVGGMAAKGAKKLGADEAQSAQAAGIIRGAGDLVRIGGTVTGFINAGMTLKTGDEAQKLLAKDQIINGVFDLGMGSGRLGKDVIKTVEAFGGMTEAAAEMALPGVTLVTASIKLVKDSKELVEHAKRASNEKGLVSEAKLAKDEVIEKTVGHMRHRDIQLASHAAVGIVSDTLKIVGDACTLSGIGAIVGEPVKAAGRAVGIVNSVAKKAIAEVQAQRTKQAVEEWRLAKAGAAEKLLERHPKHVAQALILQARQGNELAQRELELFGIDRKVLLGSTDEHLREYLLHKVEEKEDPKTIWDKLAGVVEKAGKALEKVKDKLEAKTVLKAQYVKELAEAENRMGYGGKTDRGGGWKARMFFKDTTKKQEHLGRMIEATNRISAEEKQELRKLVMTHEERQLAAAQAPSDERKISGPLHLLPKEELEKFLKQPNLTREERGMYEFYLKQKGG